MTKIPRNPIEITDRTHITRQINLRLGHADRQRVASRAFGKHYAAGVKYARYNAGGTPASTFGAANVDTEKAWLWGEMKF